MKLQSSSSPGLKSSCSTGARESISLLTAVYAGRPQFLAGCWPEAVASLHMRICTGLLIHAHNIPPAFLPSGRELRVRKRVVK